MRQARSSASQAVGEATGARLGRRQRLGPASRMRAARAAARSTGSMNSTWRSAPAPAAAAGSSRLASAGGRRRSTSRGPAVRQEIGVIVGGVGGVGRHRDGAGAHDGEIGDAPFRAVLGDDATRSPAPSPSRPQPRAPEPRLARRRARQLQRLVGAVVLGPEKRAPRLARPAARENSWARFGPDPGVAIVASSPASRALSDPAPRRSRARSQVEARIGAGPMLAPETAEEDS